MPTPRALLWLRRRFVTGFFVAVPLIISVATLIWAFNVIDNLTGPVYARLLGRDVPGLGLATTALFVLGVGIVASNVLGKRLLQRAELLLLRVPVFRTVYSPVRQLLAAFSPDRFAALVPYLPGRSGPATFGLCYEWIEGTLDYGCAVEVVPGRCCPPAGACAPSPPCAARSSPSMGMSPSSRPRRPGSSRSGSRPPARCACGWRLPG